MKKLIIIANTPSPNTIRLANSIKSGAQGQSQELNIALLSPFDVDAETLNSASGIILMTTENFGYMSGAMKDMFDRTYYGAIDEARGTPYALVIKAGKDGTGATRACEGIIKGLGWRAVQAPLVLRGPFQESWLEDTQELGAAFALGLAEGIF